MEPRPDAYSRFILATAASLRGDDRAPQTLGDWQTRRAALLTAIGGAMGGLPETPAPLEPKTVGSLRRDGYRIEKVVFQSQPDVWVTSSLYLPDRPAPAGTGKAPAVLVVHGHWPFARRDPVVQARCLGLVKLGFVVLAVDAFGAGERHPVGGKGAYHGALIGGSLWPAGHTLLGLQVYDNRRAVDYLVTRPEVDPGRLGITGASGGGNQTMYAGALDERFRAVVPVCSVGNYQAYLKAACCVCEVLPGALRFTEEGDVLGLVAPRALLVISASEDAYQFSVAQSKPTVGRAEAIYRLYGEPTKLGHAAFQSPHAYNRSMRESMYGWMSRWLNPDAGNDGGPIPEPAHTIETPEDLACFPGPADRPKGFLFPAGYAARSIRTAHKRLITPDHPEAWESTAVAIKHELRTKILAQPSEKRKPVIAADTHDSGAERTTRAKLKPENGLTISFVGRSKKGGREKQPVCVLLDLDGEEAGLKHPIVTAAVARGWAVVVPELRATGKSQPAADVVHEAPDHNSAEHGIWVGRPLLSQWITDVSAVLAAGAFSQVALIGFGQAGLLALAAGVLLDDVVTAIATVDGTASLITDTGYAAGTRMGTLAPGLARAADVPHLAALAAPRRLVIADGRSPDGQALTEDALRKQFAFTREVYRVLRAANDLTIRTGLSADDICEGLFPKG